MEAFDDNFNEAIQQLLTWGGVIMGEDARYVPSLYRMSRSGLTCLY